MSLINKIKLNIEFQVKFKLDRNPPAKETLGVIKEIVTSSTQ
jgi:hypothetical protein